MDPGDIWRTEDGRRYLILRCGPDHLFEDTPCCRAILLGPALSRPRDEPLACDQLVEKVGEAEAGTAEAVIEAHHGWMKQAANHHP